MLQLHPQYCIVENFAGENFRQSKCHCIAVMVNFTQCMCSKTLTHILLIRTWRLLSTSHSTTDTNSDAVGTPVVNVNVACMRRESFTMAS